MSSIRNQMTKETRGAIVQYALFRWENAVVLAGTIVLTGLMPKPFPWWPIWGWPLLGLLGIGAIFYSSLTNEKKKAELQALLELAKSKEIVVKTMKSLDDLMGSGDSDISGLAHNIYARLDKATTVAEIRAKSLDEQMDEVLDRQAIDAQLEIGRAHV